MRERERGLCIISSCARKEYTENNKTFFFIKKIICFYKFLTIIITIIIIAIPFSVYALMVFLCFGGLMMEIFIDSIVNKKIRI